MPPIAQRDGQLLAPARWPARVAMWAGLVAACSLFGVCNLYSWYPVRSRAWYGPQFEQAVLWELLRWNLWLPLAALLLRLVREDGRSGHAATVARYVAIGLCAPAIHTVLLVGLYWLGTSMNIAAFLRFRATVLVTNYLNGIIVAAMVLGLGRARGYYLRLREEEVRASQLQAQLAEASLEAIKMQLHPHFLFNTLNAISALHMEEPATAQRMLVRLADFLRLTLESSGVHEITLDREVDFVARYLEMERVRFPHKLAVEITLEPVTRGALVPNLILQPIVENAIRHGIAATVAPGRIEIHASRRNGSLLLSVRDTGPGLRTAGAPSEGRGLAITRSRLERMYGSASSMRIENASGGGTQVSIELPFVLKESRA